MSIMKPERAKPQRAKKMELAPLTRHLPLVDMFGDRYYQIANNESLMPFFMSLVSSSDHWFYIASNGGLSVGRRNASSALFPYYPADKIIDLAHCTGPRTHFHLPKLGARWNPFSRSSESATESIYLNESNSSVMFEEWEPNLQLRFRYRWNTSRQYGFVRSCELVNESGEELEIRVLDGLLNVLPAGLEYRFQQRFSNLGDAYKKSEFLNLAGTAKGLAIYYLSSVPSDRAEPSEGLRATTVFHTGLEPNSVLLSETQRSGFLRGVDTHSESDVRGKRGAYLVDASIVLQPGESKSWMMVAEVEKDQSEVTELAHLLSSNTNLESRVREDIESTKLEVAKIICSSDGLQSGREGIRVHRHRANATFNLMRGGVPVDGYRFPKSDFLEHLGRINPTVLENHRVKLDLMEETSSLEELHRVAKGSNDLDFERIAGEYLPLTFGRRHGDPTRPWNEFNIATHDKFGQPALYYEGNWRDIFQNWEALGISYPKLLPAMVLRFANTSTIDGYNPYRINKTGFDWEKVDPDDPWANIGYWGDHQIIYNLRLLESARRIHGQSLEQWLQSPICVFADVPYRIASYKQILSSPSATIDFENDKSDRLIQLATTQGEDAKLVAGQDGPLRSTLAEKLLISGLTKLGNLIPDAGIWLNTQRPEWNDANNALVGNGASVVTTFYLARFFDYLKNWWSDKSFQVAEPIYQFMLDLKDALLSEEIEQLDGKRRRAIVDRLQQASECYRLAVYADDVAVRFENKRELSIDVGQEFFEVVSNALASTCQSSRRPDSLFHSYNLVEFGDDEIEIEHLDEMLEGQVAALASGKLESSEAVMLLKSLRVSRLYREDAGSYMLYPNRQLDSFLEKNIIDRGKAATNPLIQEFIKKQEVTFVVPDATGAIRFVGDFRNAAELSEALDAFETEDESLATLVERHKHELAELFESTFDHRRFTGRSQTFFAYEGLGSIYWHMVSKLVLASFECWQKAVRMGDSEASELLDIYRELRDGLGVERKASEYGAFPTIPYSHTPLHAGAQQPGMTGQVKEDLISRMSELGVVVENGVVRFELEAFEARELHQHPFEFRYWDVDQTEKYLAADHGFAFTFCQTLVLYQNGENSKLEVVYADGSTKSGADLVLNEEDSTSLFSRSGKISQLRITHAF